MAVTKTLKRIRFNPDDYKISKPSKPSKPFKPDIPKIKEDKLPYYRRMGLRIYIGLFRNKFGRPPFNRFIEAQINQSTSKIKSNTKSAKYRNTFDKIAKFLLETRAEYNSVNRMDDLLKDYFTCILDYYEKFRRIPNINQLGPGPTNQENFIQYATQEEHFGFGYWLEQKHLDYAIEVRNNPDKYKMDDPFMDLQRMKNGFPPMYRKNRTLSPDGEIVEDGVVKIYSPIGKLLETRPL